MSQSEKTLIKTESEPITLEEKIKECMIHNPQLGGRYTLEIDLEDAEEIMYLATSLHHNSKCPVCKKNVSCVCTEKCNHIWYCSNCILNHEHRQNPYDVKEGPAK